MKYPLQPGPEDALVVVDVQRDFLPGGSLAVKDGDQVIPVIKELITVFGQAGRPVFATRDWHPSNHCSFREQGGPWPPHCVAGSPGAEFSEELQLGTVEAVISKATAPHSDAYSGFDGTDLRDRLMTEGVSRIFVGGLATDYCVLNTVLDGLAAGFEVVVVEDAVRPVNVKEDDGEQALEKMRSAGASILSLENARSVEDRKILASERPE